MHLFSSAWVPHVSINLQHLIPHSERRKSVRGWGLIGPGRGSAVPISSQKHCVSQSEEKSKRYRAVAFEKQIWMTINQTCTYLIYFSNQITRDELTITCVNLGYSTLKYVCACRKEIVCDNMLNNGGRCVPFLFIPYLYILQEGYRRTSIIFSVLFLAF